jgi:hypothetical protein
MTSLSDRRVLIILVLVSALVASLSATSVAQVTNGDGYITEGENTTRAIDFRTATSTAPLGQEFEVEIIVANYGVTSKSIDLGTQIRNVDATGNVEGVVDDDVVNEMPSDEYSVTLEPGEHRRYSFLLEFSETGRYAVRIVDTNSPVNTLSPTQKFVNISEEGTSFDGSLFVDRDKIDTEYINIVQFKDENSADSNIPSSTVDIPPVETNDREEITDVDVGVGTVESFQDIVTNQDLSGQIKPSSGKLNIGFSASTESESRHYGLSISYTSDSINNENLELKIVNSLDEEVDRETDYKLPESTGTDPRTKTIHLSSKEVQYIKSQNEVNVVLEGDNVGSGSIDLYDLRLVSSNDIFELPEPELSATVTAQPNTATVGDRVTITAQIENTGSASAYRQFRLYEENVLDGQNALKVSDRRIVNPEDTTEFTFTYELQQGGEHIFRVLDATASVDVKGTDLFGINPIITTNPQTVTTGQPVDFSITSVNSTKVDENVKEFRWYFGDLGTVDETISNPTSPADATVDYTFSSEGSKQIFLEYDYEDDGRTEIFRRSTVIDVIGEPEPNVTAYYSDFGTIESRNSISVSGSVSGVMSATSCQLGCGGEFVLYEDYPVTDGINMLILDRNNTSLSYSQTFYGTYEVGKTNGNYSTTTSFESSDLDQMRNELASGTTGSPSQQLLSDIQEYRNGDEDTIFIFTSAGNPQPAGLRTDIYSELTDLGANLDGGHKAGTVLEQDSIWFFATQQTGGGGVPMYERYVSPSVDNPSISESVEIRDVEVQTSGTVPVGRKLYLSAENTKLAGTIEDATVNWDDRGDGTQDTGLRTGVTYESAGTKQVKVTVEDVYGSEGTATFEYVSGSRPPTANISSSDLVIGEQNLIDSTDSYDNDGFIQSYVWTINGKDTITGQNPSYSWSKIGENEVKLTVTDRFGNTDSITKNVFVSPEPPEPKININRLATSYDDRPNTPYYIREEPVTHHTFNNISNGFSPDVWGGYSGEVGSGIQSSTGFTNGAANLSGTQDVVSIRHTDEFNSTRMTVSTWIKPETISGKSSLVSKNGVFDLKVSGGNLIFVVEGSASYQASDINLTTGNWTHVAVSYSNSGNIVFSVNGEVVEKLPSSSVIGYSNEPVVLGNNNLGESYSGQIGSFRMYDENLGGSEFASMYAREASIQLDRSQNVFYEFGQERYDVQVNQGSVTQQPNRFVLTADSSSGSNDTATINTEAVDLRNYDSVKVTYQLDAQRRETIGNPITGRLRINTAGNQDTVEVIEHRNDLESGVVSLDVSSISATDQISISADSFGSNRGTAEVQVFEIWGERSVDTERNVTDFFSSNIYPADVSNTRFTDSRRGVLQLSNALPEGEIVEIDVKNNNTRPVSQHQVKLNIQHRSGMSDNFSDVKFFDKNGVELDHWVQNHDAGTRATMWVEVSEISAKDVETIRMLYNSPQYSNTSSGEDTFEYFDNFDTDSSQDWTVRNITSATAGEKFIWQPSQSRVTTDVTGSTWYATYDSTQFDNSLDNGFVAQTRVRNEGSNGVGIALRTESGTNYNPYVSMASSGLQGVDTTLDEAIVGYTGASTPIGLQSYGSIGGSDSIPNYHTVGLAYNGGSGIVGMYDGARQDSSYSESGIDVEGIGIASLKNLQPAYYDWFIIRKYAEQQPTVVDKRYRDSRDVGRSLLVSNLTGSNGDVSSRYDMDVPDSTIAGTNIFSSDTYSIDGSIGSTTSVYCTGIGTVPSCTDTGDSEGNLKLTRTGLFGVSSSLYSDGVQRFEQFESVVDTGNQYSTVLLNATDSVAVGDSNRIAEYEWDTDGGQFDVDYVGEEIQLTLADGNSKEVSLRVRDITGAENTTTIQVSAGNEKPEIDISAPTETTLGEETFFTSSVSDDNEKKVAYIFDTGDKTVVNPREPVTKSFANDGKIDVTAVVVDEYGLTSADSTTITVEAQAPDVSGLPSELQANVRDTIVFDTTGNVTEIDSAPRSITTIYDASDISNPNNDELNYRWVLPNGQTKEGKIVQYVPQNITGDQDSVTAQLYVTNSLGQTSRKNISISTINEGPEIDNLTYRNYNKNISVFVESSTCDSPGYCSSIIKYDGKNLTEGRSGIEDSRLNDGERGINLLVLNDDNKPIFFGGYDVHSGGDYVTANGFDNDGTVSGYSHTYCNGSPPDDEGTGCVTPELVDTINRFKDKPDVRMIFIGDDQPAPWKGQSGRTVTDIEAELYNTLQTMGADLNSSGGIDRLETYTENFNRSSLVGWSSDEGTLTQKADTWAAPKCKDTNSTERISSTEMSVGDSSGGNTFRYNAKLAALDSWDDEDLVLEFRYDGSWNEVDRRDPAGGPQDDGGSQLHEYETYDSPPSAGKLDCPGWSGDGPIDIITFSGQVSASGQITGTRVRMVDDESGDGPGIQDDVDESFGIDRIQIREVDYDGSGFQYRDMWYFEAVNDGSATTTAESEGWERRGDLSDVRAINNSISLERNTTKDGDMINVSVEAYVPHPRISGDIRVETGDGSVYTDEVNATELDGHTYTFNHTVNIDGSEVTSLPVKYPINATITDDYNYTDNEVRTVNIGASVPNAQISINPSQALLEETVTFNGSGSTDPQGSNLTYDWSLGDGTTATGEVVTNTYSSSEEYDITLEVTNEFGLNDTTNTTLPVIQKPDVTLSAASLSESALRTELDASATVYGDNNGVVEYRFYPGDGSGPINTTSPSITHQYSTEGQKDAGVQIVDAYGQTASDNKTVDLNIYNPNVTSCGKTQGRVGPTQLQCNIMYSGTDLEYDANVYEDGIQEFQIEESGYYRITTAGAGYSNDGRGAVIEGKIYLSEGTTIQAAVGQQGKGATFGGGGSGGTFLAVGEHYKTSTPLFVAGGGANGGNHSGTRGDPNASTSTSGHPGHGSYSGDIPGGSGGSGGSGADGTGGGGFYTDGAGGQATGQGGYAFRNGAEGAGADVNDAYGGFGGGGVSEAGGDESGGGGGYSGGGGADDDPPEHAGGGGSYVHPDATNIDKRVGNSGAGYAKFQLVNSTKPNPRSCTEYKTQGSTGSGTYTVQTVGDSFRVYCEMNPDTSAGTRGTSGGPVETAYSFKYVQNGQVTRNLADSNTCRDNKMRLFQPRGPDEYDAGRNYVIDDYGYSPSNWDVHSTYDYNNLGGGLGPLGVYIGMYGESGTQSNGNVNFDAQEYRILKSEHYGSTSQTLGADNLYGEGTNGWRTAISERFWVATNSVDNTEPNGDYDAYDWFGWQAYDSQGYVTDYNDYPGGTYGYDSYLCWIPPR